MYTENTSIGELLELPQVMALLEKAHHRWLAVLPRAT